MFEPTDYQLGLLLRIQEYETTTGDAAPFSDLYDQPRESNRAYAALRELEDRGRYVRFEHRANPSDPWSNKLIYLALTPRGAGLLADAMEREAR